MRRNMKKDGSYDWLLNMPIYVMKPNMPLFHITPFNIPFNQDQEERPWLAKLGIGEWATNLSAPVYFSLAEEHTIYYDSWDTELGQWRSAHLSFTTVSTLKLIDFGKFPGFTYDKEMEEWLMYHGIDGWIHYDDPHDTWREVFLFSPEHNVKLEGEIFHEYFDTKKWKVYPAAQKEQQVLNRYCIGKHKLGDLIVP